MKTANDKKRANSNSGSLGQFLRNRQRMVHVSRLARMIPNPLAGQPGFAGPPLIPWTQKHGTTLNTGRNAAKRAKRAAQQATR